MSKRRRSQGNVELNLAAMLDMAFQLLTFFIFTFKPNPVEGQITLRLPPPQPVINASAGKAAGSEVDSSDALKGVTSLVITVLGTQSGNIGQMAVGDSAIGSPEALETRLATIFSDEASAFDQVLIQVGSNLNYDGLMRVIDACTKQKLPNGERLSKLSFAELPQE